MKKILFFVLFLLFVVFALTLNLQNPGSITLKYYYFGEANVALSLVLIIPFVFGLLLGALLMSISVFRNKVAVGKTKRQLAKVEKEVESLRTLPLSESELKGATLPGES
ncbi:LapA family protein [Arenicella xantha]|uniref:Putative membrane protein n=1 Tax=Arenicella xantha TaxID=644221 RepID=A0A395JL03_9GAMM|nr:LapA family protein [Arenicella xantha]RBP51473.1 putative membrane protein [Arenicella xantha]